MACQLSLVEWVNETCAPPLPKKTQHRNFLTAQHHDCDWSQSCGQAFTLPNFIRSLPKWGSRFLFGVVKSESSWEMHWQDEGHSWDCKPSTPEQRRHKLTLISRPEKQSHKQAFPQDPDQIWPFGHCKTAIAKGPTAKHKEVTPIFPSIFHRFIHTNQLWFRKKQFSCKSQKGFLCG